MPAVDKKVWYALDVSVEPEAVEAVEFALNDLGALGTEISDFPRKESEAVIVVAYFDTPPDAQVLEDRLHSALSIYSLSETAIVSWSVREIEDIDWLAEWRRHWTPTEIGRFIVAAPWHKVEEPDKIVIRIEPNMAFGTGTHETTQLCLAAIEKHFRPNDSFLDVGTGTGILAIAAAKLSAPPFGEIMGIDTDPDSIKIARENAVLNTVSEHVRFQLGSIGKRTPKFDFICANLTLDVIGAILPLLLAKANRRLVLSGILVEQEAAIRGLLVFNGADSISVARSGEWIAVTI